MISLGIDIGGTGCKCVAFSDAGEQLALSYEAYPLEAGTVNLPPEMLTNSAFNVIRDCANRLSDKEEIAAITVSSFGESFVAVHEDGNALDDIRMYFGNSESAAVRIGRVLFMQQCFVRAMYKTPLFLYTSERTSAPTGCCVKAPPPSP